MELAFSPTSNDLLFRLAAQQTQQTMNYTVIAQSADEVQEIENAPAVSIGPYLIAMPDYPLRYAVTPVFTRSTDTSEQSSRRDSGRCDPAIDRRLDPLGQRHGPNVTALVNEIDYRPVFFALLQVRELQIGQFAATQPTAKQYGKDGAVSLSFECVRWRRLPEATCLLCREPVSETHTQLLDAFHAPYPGSQFWTEQAGIGGFVGEPSYCRKSPVDRSYGEVTIFKEDAETGDDDLVEREARLGTIPLDEFIDGVPIAAL